MSNTVICNECLIPMVKKHADLEFKHPVVGRYTTVAVVHFACEKCGDKIIPPIEASRIEEQGTTKHLVSYLEANGKQPFQTVKSQMLCDEVDLRSLVYKLKAKDMLTVEKIGELEVLDLGPKAKEPIKHLTAWQKLVRRFKGT